LASYIGGGRGGNAVDTPTVPAAECTSGGTLFVAGTARTATPSMGGPAASPRGVGRVDAPATGGLGAATVTTAAHPAVAGRSAGGEAGVAAGRPHGDSGRRRRVVVVVATAVDVEGVTGPLGTSVTMGAGTAAARAGRRGEPARSRWAWGPWIEVNGGCAWGMTRAWGLDPATAATTVVGGGAPLLSDRSWGGGGLATRPARVAVAGGVAARGEKTKGRWGRCVGAVVVAAGADVAHGAV